VFLLVLAYPGCPGQKPLNDCVCVCMCVVVVLLSSIIISIKSLYFGCYCLCLQFNSGLQRLCLVAVFLLGLLAVYAFDYLHAIKHKQWHSKNLDQHVLYQYLTCHNHQQLKNTPVIVCEEKQDIRYQ